MLPSVNILSENLLALSPTLIPLTGATAFVGVIADYMNQVNAHPGGTVGIFTLANEVVIPLIVAMPPVADNSWIPVFANALQAGIIVATITPGTVTDPIWLGSGGLDVATASTGAATITTIPAATAALISALASATAGNNPAVPFAQAINDCTLQFIFTCIGLGAPPAFTPIPIPLGAE